MDGKIARFEPFGLGFISSEDGQQHFAFTPQQIYGYRGEPLRELNLRPGTRVHFDVLDGKAVNIQPLEAGAGLARPRGRAAGVATVAGSG